MGCDHGLVEREAELEQLRTAATAAAGGTGALVVIEGPAGIGKSRLVAEMCALASEERLQVLRARGGLLERDIAYGAVRLLLERALATLEPAEHADVMAGAAALAAPALAAAGGDGQAPDDRGHAVVHGLFWCIANLAARRPLLLALDDAHWFDAPSLRFLLYLARRVADLPVALVVATRQDERGPEPLLVQQLTLEPDAEILRPAPLGPDGVARVLARRLDDTVDPEFGIACHAAVGGNPFLLAELAGALAADGIRPTARSTGQVRHVRPPTLSRAILLRLGRMPVGVAEIATAVAVLGDGASLEQAADLAGQRAGEAAAALDSLAAAEILAPVLPLAFVHPIVREAVYGELGPAERARWHARAAELILADGGPIERAAPHLLSTPPGGRAQTVTALRGAARGALDRGPRTSRRATSGVRWPSPRRRPTGPRPFCSSVVRRSTPPSPPRRSRATCARPSACSRRPPPGRTPGCCWRGRPSWIAASPARCRSWRPRWRISATSTRSTAGAWRPSWAASA